MNKVRFNIHPLFILFLFVFIYQGEFILLVSYILTVCLHEYAHYLMAKKLGYKLNQFTLMPYGVSLSGQALFSIRDEILIAIAGPLCNICLAIVGIAVWWLFPTTYLYTLDFVFANTCIGLFNLIPIFPMDGGRVALACFSKKMSRKRGLKILKIVGIVVSAILVVLFVMSIFYKVNFTFILLAVFCLITILTEDKTTIYQHTNLFTNKLSNLKKGIVVREIAVYEGTTLYKLITQIKADSITNFRVLKADMSLLGYINENQLEKLIQKYPANVTLKTILN